MAVFVRTVGRSIGRSINPSTDRLTVLSLDLSFSPYVARLIRLSLTICGRSVARSVGPLVDVLVSLRRSVGW